MNNELARVTLDPTLVAAFSNLLLAALTAIYVLLTHQMVKQVRAARDPSVFIDLEFPRGEVRLTIGNSGQSPAMNIRFSISEDISWGPGPREGGLKSLNVIRNGLSFLPPDRTLKFPVGWVDWEALKGVSPIIGVKITFENDARTVFVRDYQINLSEFTDVSLDTYRDSAIEVAKAIREVEQSRSAQESMKSFTGRLFASKKTCPMCASSIPRAAIKCPKCQEFLPAEESIEENHLEESKPT